MNSDNKSNILILTYWSFRDALIQTYTLPYVRLIRQNVPKAAKLYLVTLEQTWPPQREDYDSLLTSGIVWVPFRYHSFGWRAASSWISRIWLLAGLIRRHRISVIHPWCTPAGAIGYILSKITGRMLVLDSYEPHAEAMLENGSWKRGGIAFKILFWLEKRQSHHASIVISATEGMRQYAFRKYGAKFNRFYVKPACVDLSQFRLEDTMTRSELDLDGKIVCVYAGKFGGMYLDQEVFDFFAVAARYYGERFRVLLLTNQSRTDIDMWSEKAGVNPSIVISRFVPHREIPRYLSAADFAITPVKPVPSKRFCTPIKNGEYWAMGLPVVIPAEISDDSEIILRHHIGAVLHELSPTGYEVAIRTIDTLILDPTLRNRIRDIATRYRNYSVAEKIYHEVYGTRNIEI